jgi:hypothetical protein
VLLWLFSDASTHSTLPWLLVSASAAGMLAIMGLAQLRLDLVHALLGNTLRRSITTGQLSVTVVTLSGSVCTQLPAYKVLTLNLF